MLPKETVPEGSRKVLNGVEVYTRHNFTTERGNIFETMDGNYILPNGKSVEDRSLLEDLPDPQRQVALAWWDHRFGATVKIPEKETAQPNMADLMAENEALKAQIAGMKNIEEPDKNPEVKETKRSPGRPKMDKGPDILKQMGING